MIDPAVEDATGYGSSWPRSQEPSWARPVGPEDEDAVGRFLRANPVQACLVAARLPGADRASAGPPGQLWAYGQRQRVRAVWLDGPSLVIVGSGPDADAITRAIAWNHAGHGRRCSSIVGTAEVVRPLWSALNNSWGPCRELRPEQPLLAIDRPPSVAPHPGVRRVRPEELDVLLPAAVAMFREEVGVDPGIGDGGRSYRARVAELIALGRSFAWIEDGQVLFKAELGAVSGEAAQIQGIWVRPDLRDRGIGQSGTAAVVAATLSLVPVVSLYVNDYNTRARAAYTKVGFSQVGSYASVLF